jgi:hypothetical protein
LSGMYAELQCSLWSVLDLTTFSTYA